ncbi:SMI1/KNR4 family protein [Kitasatospora sp. NPDC096147]|uniref:SMI1/KNR4 family protein n=1 Tax=Kitasatospora sp. NPDC096147 TaxID=3364093 RepID=UPI0038126944
MSGQVDGASGRQWSGSGRFAASDSCSGSGRPLGSLRTVWREAALEVFKEATFRSPVQVAALADAEGRLGCQLPAELRQLLMESNGIIGRSTVGTVWPVEKIVEQNLLFRSDSSLAELYMPFGALLFFGDNGGGDQFAFVRTPQRPDIFVWEHETDSRRWVAGDLRDYLGRSLAKGGDDWYQ